ncbi:Phosphatase 2C family protein [Rhynchospora pubera]|uniref:protein-serine/threonine phosphatase n=1 Tax=Rhynchospora pubera TaxID=906938 RepID=A0AAV8HJV7_9POAL|nr:Phosphatase 2C family protein [Rhynchospora pubera]
MDRFCCFRGAYSQSSAASSSLSGKGKSTQGHTKVSYGFSLIKGMTNHPMEDYHVADFVRTKGHDLAFFAIFDGHLGHNVPEYLQKNLFNNILREEEFWTQPDRAIIKAYDKTDQAILSHRPDLGQGGSTAVTAILVNGSQLWVANIGDSRSVLFKGGDVFQMTTDHDPNADRSSIENKGGFVSNMPGDVPRVNGQLAVARAFGDRNLKSHLRSDPDIQVKEIDHTAELLILASDGLWKVMNNNEAVEIAKRSKDPQVAAKQLTAEALKRESKDDISCIVVRFKAQ